MKTSQGEIEIEIESPRDRDASFEPVLIPKRKKDVSAIEEKVGLVTLNWTVFKRTVTIENQEKR